jgi:hypothetical protein
LNFKFIFVLNFQSLVTIIDLALFDILVIFIEIDVKIVAEVIVVLLVTKAGNFILRDTDEVVCFSHGVVGRAGSAHV